MYCNYDHPYIVQVLLNRAVGLSSLGYLDSAVEDLLAALQCKVELRHNIIDASLENIQVIQYVLCTIALYLILIEC